MIWNLLGLQRKLDALFDEGWIRLGIGSGDASHLALNELLEGPTESACAI